MDQLDIAAKEERVRRIRITSHGKIKNWVAFSLQFLASPGTTTSSQCTDLFTFNRKPQTVHE